MKDAELLRYLVLAVQREGNRRLATAFATIGLTPSQAEVIRVLHQAGRISLRRLGELLVCESGTNPSRLVDRLVASGHVERTPSGDDRRQVWLELTASGLAANAGILRVEHEMYAAIERLVDPAQLVQAINALRAIAVDSPAAAALTEREGLG